MRIIAGKMRGMRLISPPGNTARPTQDRVREAVLGSLQFEMQNKNILDLFAGSGAMGLEAISRGAAYAHFVDADAGCARTIRLNAEKMRVLDQVRISQMDFRRAVDWARMAGEQYDIVFLDPPYCQGILHEALLCLRQSGCMRPEAVWVVEQAAGRHTVYPGWEIIRQKRYGGSVITFLKES